MAGRISPVAPGTPLSRQLVQAGIKIEKNLKEKQMGEAYVTTIQQESQKRLDKNIKNVFGSFGGNTG